MDVVLAQAMSIVPDASWSFARINANNTLSALLGSSRHRQTLKSLSDEFQCHQKIAKIGPRIAASFSTGVAGALGVTLIFADAQSHFGILMLERAPGMGAFTSTEVKLLTLALSAISETLAMLRLQQDIHHAPAMPRLDQKALQELWWLGSRFKPPQWNMIARSKRPNERKPRA